MRTFKITILIICLLQSTIISAQSSDAKATVYISGTIALAGGNDPDEPNDTEEANHPFINSQVENDYSFGPVSISFNPLGFALVGPVIQADIMVAQRISIVPQIRFAGLGALMHSLSDFDELWLGSMAFGVGVRGFLGKFDHPGKTYIGCIFELGWGKGKDNPGTFSEARYEFATFAIIPHAGYRWRFSSGFFMNLGGSLGIAYTFKDERVYPSYKVYDGDLNIIPMAEYSLGWEIK